MTILNFVRVNIINFWTKFDNKLDYRLRLQIHSIFFLLDVNYNKFTIELHFFLISSIFVKFQKVKDQYLCHQLNF